MKRVNSEKKTEGLIWWKKTGGGTFLLRRSDTGTTHIIKQGQKFQALPQDIPDSFRDSVRPTEDLPIINDAPKKVEKQTYAVEHKGGGRYIVLDSNQKQVNEGYVSRQEGLDLIKELEA